MNKITLNEYQNDGIIIDVEDVITYKNSHIENSINIPYETLLYNLKNLLDKDKKYYICCKKGNKSRRVVNILEIYGYNVTQLII